MSIFAHATHIFIPDNDTGRLIATALLRSEYSLIISKPYGKWLNAYLPMGLSYKDVKDFPTATCLELNCYEGENLEIRLFTSDRLAFQFESGIGDAAEKEEELLKIASEFWAKDNPELIEKAREAMKKAQKQQSESEDDEMDSRIDFSDFEKVPDFWSLSDDEKKPYLEKAEASDEYGKFGTADEDLSTVPATDSFEKIIPEGKSREELDHLLKAIQHRIKGEPEEESVKATVAKYMDGKNHSSDAIDYLKAFANFFEVKGSAWSLETIQEKLGDKVDRRIIGLDHLA